MQRESIVVLLLCVVALWSTSDAVFLPFKTVNSHTMNSRISKSLRDPLEKEKEKEKEKSPISVRVIANANSEGGVAVEEEDEDDIDEVDASINEDEEFLDNLFEVSLNGYCSILFVSYFLSSVALDC